MSWYNKVAWSDGVMFRTPQFQQQERYLEHYAHKRAAPLSPFFFGFSHYGIDTEALALGKVIVKSAAGIFADGTPFDTPGNTLAPAPLTIRPEHLDQVIYLAVPVRAPNGEETSFDDAADSLARYAVFDAELRDTNSIGIGSHDIQLSRLRLRLVPEKELTGAWIGLALTRVKTIRADGSIELDDSLVPPVAGYGASDLLASWLATIHDLTRLRANALAQRLTGGDGGAGIAAEVSDYLLLQTLNRYEPLLQHLRRVPTTSPADLYALLLSMAGELSTYVRTDTRRPLDSHPAYSAEAGNTVIPDKNVCAASMQECAPGNGAYPVSYSLGWHGGPHLIAPRAANGHTEPVRTIADGVVVYVRRTDKAEKAALQYRGVRTDDGCVVIRHTTEIGEGDNAKVTFFSIYMHLQSVVGGVAVGKPVYRKDKLGVAGQIYGQAGQIHFEIVCDKANLQNLVGRPTGPLTASQGRTDAVYGDVWFNLPKGAMLFAKEPHPYVVDARQPPLGTHPSVQTQPSLAPSGTSCDLFIQMHYEKANCTLTTFRLEQDGRYTQVGDPQPAAGYAYNLYSEAMRLNARYTDGSTAPAVSAESTAAQPDLRNAALRSHAE
jgi:hypothetical protein